MLMVVSPRMQTFVREPAGAGPLIVPVAAAETRPDRPPEHMKMKTVALVLRVGAGEGRRAHALPLELRTLRCRKRV